VKGVLVIAEVIAILRNGMAITPHLAQQIRINLRVWCDETEVYLNTLQHDEGDETNDHVPNL
jgi:hypothetical protein